MRYCAGSMHTHLARVALAASVFALSAGAPSARAQPLPRLNGTLRASPARAANDRDVTVSVLIENRTQQQAVFPSVVLESPQLLLEVRDARGQRVETVPPPVPQGQTTTVAPGQSVRREMRLGMFSPALAPGRYTVRFRGAIIVGAPVSFTIARGR